MHVLTLGLFLPVLILLVVFLLLGFAVPLFLPTWRTTISFVLLIPLLLLTLFLHQQQILLPEKFSSLHVELNIRKIFSLLFFELWSGPFFWGDFPSLFWALLFPASVGGYLVGLVLVVAHEVVLEYFFIFASHFGGELVIKYMILNI